LELIRGDVELVSKKFDFLEMKLFLGQFTVQVRGLSPPRSRMRTHSPSPPRGRSTGDVLRGLTRNDLEDLLARASRR
jgi:hypothetical protein